MTRDLGGGELPKQAARLASVVLGSSPGTPALTSEFPRETRGFRVFTQTVHVHKCHFGCHKRLADVVPATAAAVDPANYALLRPSTGCRVAPLCYGGRGFADHDRAAARPSMPSRPKPRFASVGCWPGSRRMRLGHPQESRQSASSLRRCAGRQTGLRRATKLISPAKL